MAGSIAEPARAGLVGAAGHRDVHLHVEVLAQDVVVGHPDVVEDLLQLVVQPGGLLVVVRLVGDVDVAVTVDRDPIVWVGQVLGGQPEVDGVGGDLVEAPVRSELGQCGLLTLHRRAVGLADHLDVPEWPAVAGAAEVEVVEAERLLEHRVVALLGQRHHGLGVVVHVVAPDLVGAVGEPVGMPVVRRLEEELGAVRRACRHDDDVRRVDLLRCRRGTRRRP